MSDPLELKVGDLLPPVTVRLTDEDGTPTDLTDYTVTFTLRPETPPYDPVIDAAPTQIALDQVDLGTRGVVTYYWQVGDTDVAGDYLGSFVATNNLGPQTYPSADFVRITIKATDPPDFLAVSLGAVETAIGRTLTVAETGRATQLIQQVTALLASWLRRDLVPTAHAAETHIADEMGRVFLNHGPIRSITSVTVDDADWDITYYDPNRPLFTPGATVKVTYEAGDDTYPEVVKGVILESVSRAILAGSQVATGAVKSYSVEGTSITYGPVAGENGSVGRVAVSDLSAVRRLKRRYAT